VKNVIVLVLTFFNNSSFFIVSLCNYTFDLIFLVDFIDSNLGSAPEKSIV